MMTLHEDTSTALALFRQTKMDAIEREHAQVKKLMLLVMKHSNEIARWERTEQAIEDAMQREDKETLEDILFQFLMENAF